MPIKLHITKLSDTSWDFEGEFDQDVITVGRESLNDIHLEDRDKMVSRTHAKFERNGFDYNLVDLESVNSTFLNGKKVKPNKPYPLKDGDQVKLGLYLIEYKLVEQVTGEQGSDHTLVFMNPFEDAMKEIKDAFAKLESQYKEEDEVIRKNSLQRAVSDITSSLGQEELKAAIANELSHYAKNDTGASAVKKTAPGKGKRSKIEEEAMDVLITAMTTIIQKAWQFRSEFVSITNIETESSLHKMDAAKFKSYLFDASISDKERRVRFSAVKAQLDELLLHQQAMLDGYRATVKEGQMKLVQSLDPRQIENHFSRQSFSFGPIKIPFRIIPFLVQMKTNQAMKQVIRDIVSESPGTFDRNVFRASFVDAYMQRMTSNQGELYDSQRFWKIDE